MVLSSSSSSSRLLSSVTALALLACASFGIQGCGSEEEEPTPSVAATSNVDAGPSPSSSLDSKSESDASSPSSDAGASSDASTSDAAQTELLAPYFEMLKKNAAGTLTLTWTNTQPDCDAIEAYRKDGLHSYAVVFSVPGNVATKEDPGATLNQNYTYRLRCKKGSAFSPYSYELSENPK